METWDALRSRRNVREFSPTSVSEEDLATILEAGRLAPSAKNWQPWDFVLVTDRDQLRDLTGVWQGAWHVGGAAAAIAIVAPNPPDDRWAGLLQYDLGHATMLMMLAAADLGIGTCHSSVQDQELARKILGFPDGPLPRVPRLAWLPGRRAAPAAQAAQPASVRRGRTPRPLVALPSGTLALRARSARRRRESGIT